MSSLRTFAGIGIKHFSVDEFGCIEDRTPYPKEWINTRLIRLMMELEKLRAALGDRRMFITSGYRTERHNRQVGGSKNSQHLQGLAADIIVDGVSPFVVQMTVERGMNSGAFGFNGLGKYSTFTHVDLRPGRRATWRGK